ncbi:hypothetical protein [Aminipila terrae]|uniref:Uncharacterized protein n=1 Tax=Aminipila terrae TaxID=2697030 RepID=A0A6P1MIS3_9FIRM|nr:hypothetical protein [Aminipila terrae]QHI73807.1 hypothetical protein Ami3637_16720 [Aminipila terrae]
MEKIGGEIIATVEQALQIELYACQKDYILNGYLPCTNEKCTGKTTAYCIKLLLTEGEPIKMWSFEATTNYIDVSSSGVNYKDWFRRYLASIYKKFMDAGIETRKVEFYQDQSSQDFFLNHI